MRPGLIAGAGQLPALLVKKWQSGGLDPVVIGIEGFAEPDLSTDINLPLGSAGKIISFLKDNNVSDMVIAGRVSRPDFFRLKPDPRGMMVIAKILLKKTIGDDALLRLIREEIEKDGFRLRGIHEFLPELLTPLGLLTNTSIANEDWLSIETGFAAAIDHGRKDLGQAVVVQNGSVIAFEGIKGTNAMIREASRVKQEIDRGPILVKTCKPQQDQALDLPTAGLSTAKKCAREGFSGIVLQAHHTLLIDREEVIDFCDAHNMFLFGTTGEKL